MSEPRVTIRGGTVFIAKGATIKDVSIFNSIIVCPSDSPTLSGLEDSLRLVCRDSTISGCTLYGQEAYTKRESDKVLATYANIRFLGPLGQQALGLEIKEMGIEAQATSEVVGWKSWFKSLFKGKK